MRRRPIDSHAAAPIGASRARAFSSLGPRSDHACADMAPILGRGLAPRLRDVKLPPGRLA
jgi:hypothetical protein